MSVQDILNRKLEYCNIPQWRNSGFDGKGIIIWNGEDASADSHGEETKAVLLQVAPNAKIITAGNSYHTNGDILVDDAIFVNYPSILDEMTMDDFLNQYKPHLLSQSQSGNNDSKGLNDYAKLMVSKYNLKIFNSAGNKADDDDHETIDTRWSPDICIIVGALDLINGKPKRATYSSVGKELDFCTFTSWFTGTSFASPWLTAMTAMIYQRYGVMSFNETYKYLQMISVDLGNIGNDYYYGWGMPILPDINKKYITLTTKSNKYYVNGIEKTADTNPVNLNGNVCVPLRIIVESLGATIDWKFNVDKTINITIIKDTNTIILNTNSDIAYINGRKYILNYPPFIDSANRTLVPIRFIAESLNCKVDWVQNESKVMILEK